MLTLDNFEKELDRTILQRGRDYYNSGQVFNLEQDEDETWTAVVQGSTDYEVTIEQDPDGGLETYCDCPYDYGPYCKHVAAVLYAIRAETKGAKPKSDAKQKDRETVTKVVRGLTQEQLVEIVLEQVKKDKALGNQILLQYGKEAPGKATYERIIQDSLRAGKGEYGYIDYLGARRATKGVWDLLNKAETLVGQNQFEKAFPIVQAVLETMPSVLSNADDSDGELSGCVESAFNLLEEAAKTLNPQHRRALFDYCLAQAPLKQYQGFDYATTFLWQAGELVETTAERDTLFTALDKRLGGSSEDEEERGFVSPYRTSGRNFINEYRQEEVVEIKCNVMERLGEPLDKIHAFLLQHVHLNRVRQQLVGMYIEEKQYVVARDLCLAGLERYKDMPGLVSQYRNWLLEIARLDNDPSAVVRLAEQQLLDTGDFSYYDTLKQHIPAAEWPAFVRKLIEQVASKRGGFWGSQQVLAEIYAREGMWPQLLGLVQPGDMHVIERYKGHLHERYPDELCQVYERVALKAMAQASGRDQYRSACVYLERIIELGDDERARAIIDQLKALYPKRRAMIEELNKL